MNRYDEERIIKNNEFKRMDTQMWCPAKKEVILELLEVILDQGWSEELYKELKEELPAKECTELWILKGIHLGVYDPETLYLDLARQLSEGCPRTYY